MTAKRVTIGAKPMLVPRGEAEIANGADGPEETAAPAPAPASIEDWLRQGEARKEEALAEEAVPVSEASGDTMETTGAKVTQEPVEAPPVAPAVAQSFVAAPPLAASAPGEVTGTAPEPAAVGAHPETGKAFEASPRSSGPAAPPWAGLAGGAAAGAVAAALVAWLLPQWVPSIDARITPLSERVTHIETDLRGTSTQFGKLNNEIAQMLDEQGASVTRLDQQSEALDALRQAVAAEGRRVDPSVGIGSPVFAVALAQLRSTFYSGRPFEAELVNVYAMAGGDDLFTGYLTELMGPARTGVPNAAELHRVFPSYVAAAKLHIGDPAGYYQYGMSLMNRYVGLATESHKVEMANLAVTRANALLITGDVAGAVSALRDLDPPSAVTMAPWLEAARNYLRNETAIAEMTRIVVDRLRERVIKDMPAAGGRDPLATDPLATPSLINEPATLAPAATPDPVSATVPADPLSTDASPANPATPAQATTP